MGPTLCPPSPHQHGQILFCLSDSHLYISLSMSQWLVECELLLFLTSLYLSIISGDEGGDGRMKEVASAGLKSGAFAVKPTWASAACRYQRAACRAFMWLSVSLFIASLSNQQLSPVEGWTECAMVGTMAGRILLNFSQWGMTVGMSVNQQQALARSNASV